MTVRILRSKRLQQTGHSNKKALYSDSKVYEIRDHDGKKIFLFPGS